MIQKRIREEAKKLLENKEVDVIVGFGEGSLPLRATPIFVRNPEEVDRLIWNSFCENNLATYLHKLEPIQGGARGQGVRCPLRDCPCPRKKVPGSSGLS